MLVLFVWSITGVTAFLRVDDSRPRSRAIEAATVLAAGPLIWIALLWYVLQTILTAEPRETHPRLLKFVPDETRSKVEATNKAHN